MPQINSQNYDDGDLLLGFTDESQLTITASQIFDHYIDSTAPSREADTIQWVLAEIQIHAGQENFDTAIWQFDFDRSNGRVTLFGRAEINN